MITLINTTYYPAILLRKRWREAVARRRAGFDVEEELQRIHDDSPLSSSEVNALERWSAGRETPATGDWPSLVARRYLHMA